MAVKPAVVPPKTTPVKPVTPPVITKPVVNPPKPVAPSPTSVSSVINKAPTTGYTGQKNENMYRVEVGGKVIDTANSNTLRNLLDPSKGGKIISLPGMAAGVDPVKAQLEADIKKQIENQLATQSQAINAELAKTLQANQLAVQQNNSYLQEQLGKLGQQKVVNDDSATKLQNRRGGFYSGGLDYQLGQNASSYNEASGSVSREIAQRNADINNRNALLAEQAAQQISLMQQQAPDLIRQRVAEALQSQQETKMREASLTGKYNGQNTVDYNNMLLQQKLAEAGLTGMYNGKQTLEAQEKLWNQKHQNEIFAYQKVRDTITDQQKKMEFDEQVRQFGITFAIDQQVKLGNLSLEQARLALSQEQFVIDKEKWNMEKELAKLPQSADLSKYTAQLNKTYVQQNKEEGTYKVTNPEGLYKSIIGLNLSDDDTMKLLSLYGIDMGNFLNP